MADDNIILTGFMGTGKSTVGRLLAERLGREFVDTDEVIVARAGRPIAAIFAEVGEARFRQWEAEAAEEPKAEEKPKRTRRKKADAEPAEEKKPARSRRRSLTGSSRSRSP